MLELYSDRKFRLSSLTRAVISSLMRSLLPSKTGLPLCFLVFMLFFWDISFPAFALLAWSIKDASYA